MTTSMNDTYINALLADASYVALSDANGLLSDGKILENLKARLTQPLADFITANFEVLDQPGATDFLGSSSGFSATVWRGKSTGDYAGQIYVSMRGTAQGLDFVDDGQLAATGVSYSQIKDMVNWWLRESTPAGQMAAQIDYTTSTFTPPLPLPPIPVHNNNFVAAPSVLGTGKLSNITAIDFVNGHSLGGYLATAFERIFQVANRVSTFNSAGYSNIQTQNINDAFSQIATAIGYPTSSTFSSNIQTNYFAENGFELTTNAWKPIGFNQIGSRVALYQEGDLSGPDPFSNHYMYKITDLLALGDAISKLDPNFTITQLNGFVASASNIMGASYEKLLDGLRHTILGDVPDTLTGDASSGAARTNYHDNLKAFTDSITALNLTGKFTLTAPPTSATEARTDLGAFLSLHYLTPFALKPNDAGATNTLYQLHASIADLWNADRNLSAAQIANGEANFSDMYLNDRAAMLSWVVKRNAEDTTDPTGLPAIFRDIENNINLGGASITNPIYAFGANNADSLTGGDKADHLYGGAGDDTLFGQDGNDWLEGGADNDELYGDAGTDWLFGGAGDDELTGGAGNDYLYGGAGTDKYIHNNGDGNDVITDSDGLGSIQVKTGTTLTGGNKITGTDQVWESADHKTRYTKYDQGDGKFTLNITLENGEKIFVKDWVNNLHKQATNDSEFMLSRVA